MKVTLESTDQIATINGNVPARVWKGRTEGGVEFLAFITRIAVPEYRGFGPAYPKQDQSEFERELKETAGTELVVGGVELRGPIDLRLLV